MLFNLSYVRKYTTQENPHLNSYQTITQFTLFFSVTAILIGGA